MPNRLDHDWFAGSIGDNVLLAPDVYIDSSFGFAAFFSGCDPALSIGRGSGIYDRATLITGPLGCIEIGDFACVNASYLISNRSVVIGSHALLSWGTVVTDTNVGNSASIVRRRAVLEAAASDPRRILPPVLPPLPVVLEENVWIGFDSVILPGVRIGRGSIVGCKTIVESDVPAYSVIAGNPARRLRSLNPDDDDACRAEAFARCLRET